MRPILLALALAACATAPPPVPLTPQPAFRLSDDARPLRYQLALQVDPAQPRVYGTITIDVELARAARVVWLNAGRRVHVERAEWGLGDRIVPATAHAGDEFVGVVTEEPLPAGKARLRLEFYSETSSVEADAFFRRKVEARWYLFSHFEPLRARRAFPCFDEPRFKAPWRIVVHVRDSEDVVSNMPEESRQPEAGGWWRVAFRESPPLPSYLVALAVGAFRYYNVATPGKTPLRFVVPERIGTDAAASGTSLRRLMGEAVRRFGEFPFPKLDVVLVPRFDQAAMENVGLITVGKEIFEFGQEETLAHELAHQWFGDLVTCAWFDDTWLNESFAQFAGEALTATIGPPRGRGLWARFTLGADLRGRGRTIRVAPASSATVMESFNAYTYARGAALLRMLEAWMEPGSFQRVLRDYLEAHAFGAVTTGDFVEVLSRHAARDLGAVVKSYLDQPGLPIVEAKTVCAPGQPPRFELRQRPLRGADARWHIPICFHVGEQRTCLVLDGEHTELALAGTGCPQPRFAPADERLFLVEGVDAQVVDLHWLFLAGALSAGEVLRALPERLAGPDPPLADAISLLSDVSRLVGPQRLGWRRYLRRLGLVRQARAAQGPLRRELWPFALGESLDPELALDATAEAMAWLADPRRDDWWAAWEGVLAGSPRFLDALAKLQDRRRGYALTLLGGVQDRDRFRMFATATSKSQPQATRWFLYNAGRTAASSQSAYEYVRQLDRVILPHLGSDARDTAADVELRLAAAACIVPPSLPKERASNQADLDELALCASLRRREGEVQSFLAAE